MTTRILTVFGALIAVLLIWYEVSPLYTLDQMRKAAAEGNGAKLSNHVDYEALKIDLKGDLRREIKLEANRRGAETDPLIRLGGDVAAALAGPGVDLLVTPQAVQAMFDVRVATVEVGVPQPSSPIPVKIPRQGVVIERTGLGEFKVRTPGKDGAAVFRRYGWSWKLAGIDMPYTFERKAK
jgi:hypothetical protein